MVATAKKRGRKVIKVNLLLQILEAYEGVDRVFRFQCVSGSRDHPTDRGTFTIYKRRESYVSGAYSVRMDYAMFFTGDGKAIHGYYGNAPFNAVRLAKSASDWFGSHGCVRLIETDARALFNWTPDYTKVVIS